jgi:hypothetical protein
MTADLRWSGPIPRRTRTTYRDAYCTVLPNSDALPSNPTLTRSIDPDLDSPLRSLYTVTTYRDAFCTPHMRTDPLAVTAAGGRTRAMTTGALVSALPRNAPPDPPAEPRGRERPATTATNFWTRTTFRDAFGNPFQGCTGPLHLSADLVGARSYFIGKTGGATRSAGEAVAGVRDPKPRTVERPLTGAGLYSRTTYGDAFGMPFPLSAPLQLAASETLTGSQGGPGAYWQLSCSGEPGPVDPKNPRWPIGTASLT